MRNLKQSTAANVVVFMTDSTDHVTGKTGLTLTITASKDGAAFASISPTVTELATGWYKLALTSSHTDTLGDLALHITATGADPTDFVCRVVAVDLADSVRFGLSALPNAAAGASSGLPLAVDASGRVDVLKINGTSQTARDIGASVLVSSGTGAGQISLSSGAVTVGTNNDKTGYTVSTVSDKTGYSLSQAFPTNFASLAVTVGGAVTVGTNNDKTGYTASTVSDKTGYSLTSAYDAAKTASQAGDVMKVSSGTGANQINLASGSVTVGTNSDKTGYSLTQSFPAYFSELSIDANGYVVVATNQDKTGYTVSTVSDKTGYSLTSAYDAAKTAAQAGDVMKVSSGTGANQISLSSGAVTVGTNNDKTGYTASTVSDKTGYSLSAGGLDSITASDPGGVASTFPQMLVQLWRYYFKKSSTTNSERKTYADDGTTVRTTQSISDDGTTLTKGNAS